MKIVDRSVLQTVSGGDGAKTRKAHGSPKVETGSTVTRLSNEGIHSTADINMSRVNELKLAIAEGKFTIDADKISRSLVQSALELME